MHEVTHSHQVFILLKRVNEILLLIIRIEDGGREHPILDCVSHSLEGRPRIEWVLYDLEECNRINGVGYGAPYGVRSDLAPRQDGHLRARPMRWVSTLVH